MDKAIQIGLLFTKTSLNKQQNFINEVRDELDKNSVLENSKSFPLYNTLSIKEKETFFLGLIQYLTNDPIGKILMK